MHLITFSNWWHSFKDLFNLYYRLTSILLFPSLYKLGDRLELSFAKDCPASEMMESGFQYRWCDSVSQAPNCCAPCLLGMEPLFSNAVSFGKPLVSLKVTDVISHCFKSSKTLFCIFPKLCTFSLNTIKMMMTWDNTFEEYLF